MTELWESVGGAFWRVPPDEQWSFLPGMVVLLVAVVAGAAIAVSIAKKRKEPAWHLRQHMAEIGGALTLVYLVGIIALTWGRLVTLGAMPLNEIGDFFAGAFGPVAFLWLVLGYLQQGDGLRLSTKALELQADELRQGTEALLLQAQELKNSVEQQSIMAAAATQQIEAQKEALEIQLREADNLHRARFAFSSSRKNGTNIVGSKINTSLDVICKGADAFDVVLRFEPPIGVLGVGKFDSIHKSRASSIPLEFVNAGEDIVGTITLDYKGSDGRARREKYVYEIKFRDPWVKIKNQVSE